MAQALRFKNCPHMEQDHQFDNRVGEGLPRGWLLDFAHLDTKTAIEIDGGEFAKGHQGLQRAEDYEKRNLAMMQGWQVFQLTGRQVQRDCAMWADIIKEHIERRLDTWM